jgi:hypothetical protein
MALRSAAASPVGTVVTPGTLASPQAAVEIGVLVVTEVLVALTVSVAV